MTREQIIEAEKAIECCQQARKHLDNVMYRMGEISDADHNRTRAFYDAICRALDLV